MKHYRMYKLKAPEGGIIKGSDIEANDDHEAMQQAMDDEDCPICEVWQGTKKVGAILPAGE